MIENGLNECTLIGEKINFESLISLNESEDIVFDRNDDKQLDFNGIKLKTLKIDEDDISSTTSIETNQMEEQQQQQSTNNLLKRATSITNKLTDTFNRLTTSDTSNIIHTLNQDLSHLNQFQFPIQLFQKVIFSIHNYILS